MQKKAEAMGSEGPGQGSREGDSSVGWGKDCGGRGGDHDGGYVPVDQATGRGRGSQTAGHGRGSQAAGRGRGSQAVGRRRGSQAAGRGRSGQAAGCGRGPLLANQVSTPGTYSLQVWMLSFLFKIIFNYSILFKISFFRHLYNVSRVAVPIGCRSNIIIYGNPELIYTVGRIKD